MNNVNQNKMEKEFVTYELAVKLKVLGFDEPCCAFYQVEYAESRPTMVDDDNQYRLTGYRTCKNSEIPEHYTSAPTFSQAFRWLMQFPQIKKYRYNIALYPDGTYSLKDGKDSIYEYLSGDDCIDKLIEIVENK